VTHEVPPVSGVEQNGGATIVRLAGELDLYNAHVVREALLSACAENPERVVVDLGDVTFLDSTALGVLIEARKSLENRRAFLLAQPGLETRRALEVSGLDRHFTVLDSLDEALAADL
jgi:anti-sigma B factor antagonist